MNETLAYRRFYFWRPAVLLLLAFGVSFITVGWEWLSVTLVVLFAVVMGFEMFSHTMILLLELDEELDESDKLDKQLDELDRKLDKLDRKLDKCQ